jgi:hypothetical protein
MATQGCSQGEGSDDGSVSLIPAPLPATPSNTIRNKEASKKVIKMNMVNVLPKYVKARPLNSWMAFRCESIL